MIIMLVENYYCIGEELLEELRFIQCNLIEIGLICLELENLIIQLEVYGFNLVQLDFCQEFFCYVEAIVEIVEYMGVFIIFYEEMVEEDKLVWLGVEL